MVCQKPWLRHTNGQSTYTFKSYSCLASHRGALFRAGELHLSLIYTKDPRTMFSPTAIGDYIVTMNSADNPVVPKFMFLLNNRSSFSNPRKEAFRFRDLYHCLNPSLLWVKHIWLPTKSLQSFWGQPPGRWHILPIVQGMTATRDVQDINDFAEDIGMRKSKCESSRAKKSERFSFTLSIPKGFSPALCPILRNL